MSIYGIILEWIIIYSLCPTFYALFDRIMMPVVANGKNTLRNFLIISLICLVTPFIVVAVWKFSQWVSLMVKSDYLRVVIYVIILTVVSNEKLYIPWSTAKKLQHSLLRELSKRFFTFLPLKTILYLVSALCLVASQLEELGICRFSAFWVEFFSYHEYALLLVFSVNEIMDYLFDDMQRIKGIKRLDDEDLRGFRSFERIFDNDTSVEKVYISFYKSDEKVAKALVDRLKEEKIECWNMCSRYYDIAVKYRRKAIERSKVFVLIVSENTMNKKSDVVLDIIGALGMECKKDLQVVVYKITDSPYNEEFDMLLDHIPSEDTFFVNKGGFATEIPDALINHIKTLSETDKQA